jgi:hypothetical protein
MKKYYLFYLLALTGLLFSCKKNEMQQYNEKSAVYFSAFSDKDSLIYSMVGKVKDFDTLFVQVKLLGNKSNIDRKVSVTLNKAYTTAIEGLHFEKLKESYVFRANSFVTSIPIVLYKTDPALASKRVKLGLTITNSEDLNVGYLDRINAHIQFTNELIKPANWDSYLISFYGAYSKVKHKKCIEVQGFDFNVSVSVGKLMSYGRVMCKYYTDNIVNDENGNRIMPWAAF